jgi:hypothetical protein
MSFEIKGKIIEIQNLVQVNDRFKKQEFVIERSENNGGYDFTDYIKFQLTQDRTDLISNYQVGSDVKVSFNIRGNKWVKDNKVNYFTNLDAWKIEGAETAAAEDIPPPMETFDSMPPDAGDDLPF